MESNSERSQLRLIRKPAVLDRTGLVASELYRLIQLGQFPRQIKLGARSSAWDEREVIAWCAERVAKHRVTSASSPIRRRAADQEAAA